MSLNIGFNFFIKAIPRNYNNNIVLTFDDGPHPENTLKVLNILDHHQVKAIFFMIGKNVIAYPNIAKEVISRGHQVGIHSYNHQVNFGFLSQIKLQLEITKCQTAIKDATGVNTNLFRPPFGVTNPLISRLTKLYNLVTIGWTLRSFDTKFTSVEGLVKRVVSRVKAGNIVLLHDGLSNTCDALPEIINGINGMGFAFGSLRLPSNSIKDKND